MINLLDIIYILLLIALTFVGYKCGFIKYFINLIAWVGGVFLVNIISPHLLPYVQKIFGHSIHSTWISSGISYLIILIFLLLLSNVLSAMIKETAFEEFNSILGILLGFVLGLLLPVSVCIMIFTFDISKTKFSLIKESKISMFLLDFTDNYIMDWLHKNGTVSALQKTKNKLSKKIN